MSEQKVSAVASCPLTPLESHISLTSFCSVVAAWRQSNTRHAEPFQSFSHADTYDKRKAAQIRWKCRFHALSSSSRLQKTAPGSAQGNCPYQHTWQQMSTNQVLPTSIYLEFGGLGEPQRFECHIYPRNHDMVGSLPRMESFQNQGSAYLTEAPPRSHARGNG